MPGREDASWSTARVVEAAISEKAWQTTVVALFRAHGWRCYWTWNSVHSPAGFPDLVLTHRARRPGLLLLELKGERGRLSAAQLDYFADLAAAGHPVHVLKPSDWDLAQRLATGETPC